MYDDDEGFYRNRNDYWDDVEGRNDYWDDTRNRRRRRRVMALPTAAPPGYRPMPAPMVAAPVVAAPVAVERRGLRDLPVGVLLQAGAEALAATMALPAAPQPTGDAATDLANQTRYTTNLALHTQRQQQLRSVGAILRIFV